MAPKPSPYAENLGLVQETLERWLSFRAYLVKAFSDEQTTPDDEAAFLEIKSGVTKGLRSLGERLKDLSLDIGAQGVRDLLNKCVSLNHLGSLPAADRETLRRNWHQAFIKMSRTAGALKFMDEGYRPPVPKKKRKKGKGGAIPKPAVVALVVAAAAFAAWWFLMR